MTIHDSFDRQGFQIIPSILKASEIETLKESMTTLSTRNAGSRIRFREHAFLAKLVRSPRVRSLIEPTLGRKAIAVRALVFDKRPKANWGVRWHQDKTIAVKIKTKAPGYYGWSLKQGVSHVHPPSKIMEEMLALRLHLDEAGPANGGLQVCPGSHTLGCLPEAEVHNVVNSVGSTATKAHCGDAILMRPLLIHSSTRSQVGRRRVIHIEFASAPLPQPLEWNDPISLH